MDTEGRRIRELVIEAGALLEWVETGRADLDVIGAALLYLRDELAHLAGLTADTEAAAAACDVVNGIEAALRGESGTAAA